MLSAVRSKLFNFMVHRSICTGRPCLISEKAFQKLKLKQAKMQCEDNFPVYLKCGTRDKILYWITVTFTLYNTMQSFKGVKKLLAKY